MAKQAQIKAASKSVKAPKSDIPARSLGGVTEIEKRYGKNSIQLLNSKIIIPCDTISTGDLGLDVALGVGGIPRGRIIEIYGPESSGKTTLALHIIASGQKRGLVAAFIDAEHALDPAWARKIGVNVDNLFVAQPDNGEQGLDIADILVNQTAADIIVIDSVAALVPKAEIEGEMGDSHMGLQARLMSQAMRKLTAAVSKTKCTVIFINQIREKIGQMFGPSETTSGGKALKFYASIRLDIRKIGQVVEKEVKIGAKTKIKVVKNKVAPPFREVETQIYFGTPVSGFDYAQSILEMGVKYNVISKNGSWHTLNNERIGNGVLAAASYLRENPKVCETIRDAIIKVINPIIATEAAEIEDEDQMTIADLQLTPSDLDQPAPALPDLQSPPDIQTISENNTPDDTTVELIESD